jgi:hypothetical protein
VEHGGVIKGITIELGGVDHIVPPLTLGSLERFQDRLEAFTGGMDRESINLMADVAYAALLRNYPDLTREAMLEMLDLGNTEDVFQAVMDLSGIKRKAIAAGEAQAAI